MSLPEFEIIDVNPDNVDKIGMFCVKSKKKSLGYIAKLAWIKHRFDEGLRYKILFVDEGRKELTSRGFVEYMPSEYSWRGIKAENYSVIHCLWVVGKWKKLGLGTELLNVCLEDAQSDGKDGVAVLTSEKPFLTNGSFFKKRDFALIEKQEPYYEIYAKIFNPDATLPAFYTPTSAFDEDEGLHIFDSDQCPYNVGFKQLVERVGDELKLPVIFSKIENSAQANVLPSPYGTFEVTQNDTHFTHYYMNEKKMKDLLSNPR
jgi:GNAT superfamily N-acetyltransferase